MGNPAQALPVQVVTLTSDQLTELLKLAARDGAAAALAERDREQGVEPPLLSRTQLAKALGVSPKTVDRDIKDGLPYVRVGKHPKFDYARVRAWLDQRGAR